MGQDFEIDRQVIREAMSELQRSIDRLDQSRRSMLRLEPASFGTSELGQRTQAQTEGAVDTVEETMASLREVHDQLVQALVTVEAQAEAADAAAAADAERLLRAASTPAPTVVAAAAGGAS